MCVWGTHTYVYVIRRNNPFIADGWHSVAVDVCIAKYVQRMNCEGVITVGCCCGHFGDNLPHVLIASESKQKAIDLGYDVKPFGEREDVFIHLIKKS